MELLNFEETETVENKMQDNGGIFYREEKREFVEKTKMKRWKVLYYFTTVMSMLVGLWHFFVPKMFQWYDYLPMQYENLIVGIDYTNYCFSALLFGGSLLLVFWGKRVFTGNKESKELYFFYTIVWLIRAALATFIEPWPLKPVAWAAILQLVMSDLLAVCMVVMSIKFIKMIINENVVEIGE